MQLQSNLWRSLIHVIANILDVLASITESIAKKWIGRFLLGSILGILPSLVYWGYAIFFHVKIPLIQGIIGSLILMLAFGTAAIYGKLDQLFDALNL